MNSTRITRWFVYLLIGVAIAAIWWSYNSASPARVEIPISELAQQVQAGEVADLQVAGNGREVTVKEEVSAAASALSTRRRELPARMGGFR